MSETMRRVEVLRAACCVAGVDGHTSPAEQRILNRLASEVGVGTASLSAMIEQAETDKAFYTEQFRVLKSDPKDTMQLLFRVAVVDAKLRKEEAAVLKRLAQRLGVPPERFDQWLKQAIAYLKTKTGRRDP
jgi:tellurite resistance protein